MKKAHTIAHADCASHMKVAFIILVSIFVSSLFLLLSFVQKYILSYLKVLRYGAERYFFQLTNSEDISLDSHVGNMSVA